MLTEEPFPEPGGHRWMRWLAMLVVLVLVVAAGVWIVGPFGAQAATPVTAKSTVGTIVSSVDLSGTVVSPTVDELNFDAAGTVAAVDVAVGDPVTAGETLATIDATLYDAQLASAKADLAAAQARLAADQAGPTAATVATARDSVNQARLQLSSAEQSLSATNAQNAQSIAAAQQALSQANAKLAADQSANPAAPASEIAADQAAVTAAQQGLSAAQLKASVSAQQAQSQVNAASLGVTSAQDGYNLKVAATPAAQIASDEAQVASAQQALLSIEQTSPTLTSPIAGTVTAVNIAPGQQVRTTAASSSTSSSSTTGEIEVMDLTHLQVSGEASDANIASLKVGQAATVSTDALGSTTLVGQVCSIDLVGTQISGVTSYGVTICLNAPPPQLRVGMAATASIITDRHNGAILVPSLAVHTQNGQQVVDVLSADGKTQTPTVVQTGLTNGQQTEIVSGLNAGTTVVLSLQTGTSTGGGRGGRLPGIIGRFGG